MWEPSPNYASYYGKLVFVEYIYFKGPKTKSICGVLENISLPNFDGDYTVAIINPITKCINCIASTLITKVVHDNSIENLGKFNSVKQILRAKLNRDVVSEIPKYLVNDVVFV